MLRLTPASFATTRNDVPVCAHCCRTRAPEATARSGTGVFLHGTMGCSCGVRRMATGAWSWQVDARDPNVSTRHVLRHAAKQPFVSPTSWHSTVPLGPFSQKPSGASTPTFSTQRFPSPPSSHRQTSEQSSLVAQRVGLFRRRRFFPATPLGHRRAGDPQATEGYRAATGSAGARAVA